MSEHHGNKLKKLIKQEKTSVTALAKAFDVHRGSIYYLYGKEVFDTDTLDKLKKAGVDITAFDNSVQTGVDEKDEPEGNIIFVPLYVYGGFLTGYADQIFMNKLQRFALPGVTGEHYAFEVDGMSMHDFASPGDWVISRSEEKLENMVKGKPYVLQTTDGLLVKYFDKRDETYGYFSSHNSKEFPQIKIPLKSIKRVYFVTRMLKKL